ncbi:hypothetical protein [Streptomyces sp. NPDC005485]|uniref:hypothetical protein n=1 Tax=Streptomyces sp. NPDC005485 TaxID=3155591 RepID=UPI0033B75F3C
MVDGCLIAESLKVGTHLKDLRIEVREIHRFRLDNAGPGQPDTWTVIEFSVAKSLVEEVAEMLSGALDQPGWYVDLRTAEETFVVFPGRVLRFPRGDGAGRAQAREMGLTFGVPEHQLDWPE